MPQLVAPTVRLHHEWAQSHGEWGPGLHEDGFGLRASDDVQTPEGFATWVSRLLDQADAATAAATGQLTCRYRWVVEGDRVQGAIALRHGPGDKTLQIGHIGYGIRPSARGRGLASWALARILEEAAAVPLDRVLLVCEEDNTASVRTIERLGGVLEGVEETGHGPLRRYWITL